QTDSIAGTGVRLRSGGAAAERQRIDVDAGNVTGRRFGSEHARLTAAVVDKQSVRPEKSSADSAPRSRNLLREAQCAVWRHGNEADTGKRKRLIVIGDDVGRSREG